MERDEHHAYRITSHDEYGFHAGVTSNGRQVLMGLLCPHLVAVYFDAGGRPLDLERRCLDFLRTSTTAIEGEPISGQVEVFDIYDPRIVQHLRQWQNEIGFEPRDIKVERFFVPEIGIGIQDCPEHFVEVLADSDLSDEEKAPCRDSMRCW